MAFSVEMPALGESVTEGTITRWLKQEGDTVEVDEPSLQAYIHLLLCPRMGWLLRMMLKRTRITWPL